MNHFELGVIHLIRKMFQKTNISNLLIRTWELLLLDDPLSG